MNGSVHFYSPKPPNFGDYLNEWIWSKLLNSTVGPSLGIGSILTRSFLEQRYLIENEVLVLGSGARYENEFPDFKVAPHSFCRGPLTSKSSGGQLAFIADGAYLLRQTEFFNKDIQRHQKKHSISIMPHFRSLGVINWASISTRLGVNFIDPTMPNGLEQTIIDLAESELVISEAMHGAIVADILRVPWVQLEFISSTFEGQEVSDFKWNDWLGSIGIVFSQSVNANAFNKITNAAPFHWRKTWLKFNEKKLTSKAESTLEDFIKSNGRNYLSSDPVLQRIDDQLANAITKINQL